jgi:hypothetical protein
MYNAYDRAFKRALRWALLINSKRSWKTVPSTTTIGGIVFCLFLTVVFAEPHVRKYIHINLMDIKCISNERKDEIKSCCDFAIICLQILIALMIGGIAVTDALAAFVRTKFAELENNEKRRIWRTQFALLRDILSIYKEIRQTSQERRLLRTSKSFLTILRNLFKFYELLRSDLGRLWARILFFRLASSFPGGFYGVAAFILFEALIIIQVVKTYFDYAQTC